ncbi:hypothetical protein [Kribbella sp. VKM Ac-2568]|uniref:hypothetical protein n=1 Tax=Kribbella sp. VKM Ac-2568 TaxID=2512219 RepID=UPI0010454BC8|nr:hypothetical protein [Kribbella sp. VKM Ac-2568]TCM45726.1 hypothetical protein EV648_106188 [Kribbella sp. VKM Ac-2568]
MVVRWVPQLPIPGIRCGTVGLSVAAKISASVVGNTRDASRGARSPGRRTAEMAIGTAMPVSTSHVSNRCGIPR